MNNSDKIGLQYIIKKCKIKILQIERHLQTLI